jgi:hypothetical protein
MTKEEQALGYIIFGIIMAYVGFALKGNLFEGAFILIGIVFVAVGGYALAQRMGLLPKKKE